MYLITLKGKHVSDNQGNGKKANNLGHHFIAGMLFL